MTAKRPAERHLARAQEMTVYAALIAAAPDLLAKLSELADLSATISGRQHAGLRIDPEDWSALNQVTNEARAAVAKAEGHTP